VLTANAFDLIKETLNIAEVAANYGVEVKRNGCLLFDSELKIANITPAQERLRIATRTYAAAHSRNSDFEDIAQEIEKHYGLTKGMQNHVDDLTPKPQTKKRSYDHGRG